MKPFVTEEMASLLNLRRLPGRLTYEQAGALLGFEAHEINILVKARLVIPLANPADNALKYLCTAEVEERCSNSAWVAKATRAVYLHWRKKNKTLNSGQVG